MTDEERAALVKKTEEHCSQTGSCLKAEGKVFIWGNKRGFILRLFRFEPPAEVLVKSPKYQIYLQTVRGQWCLAADQLIESHHTSLNLTSVQFDLFYFDAVSCLSLVSCLGCRRRRRQRSGWSNADRPRISWRTPSTAWRRLSSSWGKTPERSGPSSSFSSSVCLSVCLFAHPLK